MSDSTGENTDATLRLTHIPAANDDDDTRATLAAQVHSPEAWRATDCILWQANPDHYPGHLLHDVKRWFAEYIAREGVGATYDFAAVAVAAYLLGRRDGVLTADGDRPDGGARALALGLAWIGGFVACLIIGLLGLWLRH